jgi:hypothetical protein
MAKIYCLKCNFGTEWSVSKPNFCSKCGKPYLESSASSKPLPAANKPSFTLTPSITSNNLRPVNKPIQTSDDDDIENDATSVPKIDKIECNFNVDNLRPNRQSSTEVFAEGYRGIDKDFTPKPKPQSKKRLSKAEKQAQIENAKAQFKNEFLSSSKKQRDSIEIE